jgi:hypothetical protein
MQRDTDFAERELNGSVAGQIMILEHMVKGIICIGIRCVRLAHRTGELNTEFQPRIIVVGCHCHVLQGYS